jgi:hypothetical protein
MDDRLAQLLHRLLPDVEHVSIEALEPIPGGFSRETFRFDARVRRGGAEEVLPLILRKDPPAAAALLHTSRQTEHELTLKEIGEKYNLSRERIRQLQEQALVKMRRALQRKDLM